MKFTDVLIPIFMLSSTCILAQDANIASLAHASSHTLTANSDLFNNERPAKVKKLVSFDVSTENCNGLLSWETVSNQSVELFIIEKSENANTFEEIGRVYAANSLNTYSFVDAQFTKGSFYRIKVVDPTDEHFRSQIQIANCKCATVGNWLVYPNPIVGKELTIAYQHMLPGEHDIEVQIVNEEGKVLLKEERKVNNNSDQIKIDVQNIPSGTYHIEMIQNHMPLGGQLFVKSSE